jgi:transcriptional regulator with XRE-family HTH domain
MKLLPFDRYQNAGGSTAWVSVEVNQDAAKILDIKPGIRKVRYSGGPVAYALANSKSEGKGISLGVYKSSVSRSKEQEGKFIGSPAWIYGSYGKGKVIATSFHPEYEESTHDMMLGCFYAVSGVKLTPVFPQKNYRPVRVGLLTSYAGGHKPIELMLDLERHPDIDLDYVMATELDKGILKHLDVLVVPSPQKAMLKKFFATDLRKKQFAEFMGVSQAMVSKWECGEYNFTINTLIEICDKLGMEFYPGIYNLYRGRNQFKVVNIRTADKENQPPKIPTDCRGLYSQKKGRVWTIA